MASAKGATLVQAATPSSVSRSDTRPWDTIVFGAGAFGAWTAWHLRRKGQRVLLADAWGAAHSRASSGGESRVTRTAYGADDLYTIMARDALEQWQWLSERSGTPLFHDTGVLFFFRRREPFFTGTLQAHERLKLPIEVLERPALAKRWPQIAWDGIEVALYEPRYGALMARRAVQTLVAELVKAGGEYRVAAAPVMENANDPSSRGEPAMLDGVRSLSGEVLQADRYVFACGPWLPKVFPRTVGERLKPTRQEVFFFAPEPGDSRFQAGNLPTWADFNDGDIFYGLPDLESRGFKIAHDKHGTPIDPDTADRTPSAAALAEARAFMKQRFPALANRPVSEARVCQYENTANGDFIIDAHPAWRNVWLVGGGSGHGFKHAPEVGRYTADLVTGSLPRKEPRFSL